MFFGSTVESLKASVKFLCESFSRSSDQPKSQAAKSNGTWTRSLNISQLELSREPAKILLDRDPYFHWVILAQTRIQAAFNWTPACAGVTIV
jgi:hypothetical protein